MLIRIVILALLSALVPAYASAPLGPVLVLGDSLSAAHNMPIRAGWVSLLATRLGDADCPEAVVNASISGETTAGGLTRLPGLLDAHQPSIVILELGGNDGLQGKPTRQTRANLTEMIQLSRDAGAKVLLAGIQIPTNYGRRYAEGFRDMYPGLADEFGIALVPFLLEGIALEPTLMQSDQIHPNADAQPLVLANVLPTLAPMLETCQADLSF